MYTLIAFAYAVLPYNRSLPSFFCGTYNYSHSQYQLSGSTYPSYFTNKITFLSLLQYYITSTMYLKTVSVVMYCYYIQNINIILHVIFVNQYSTSYGVNIITFTSSNHILLCVSHLFYCIFDGRFATKSPKYQSTNGFWLLAYLSMLPDNLISSELGCNCCSLSLSFPMNTHTSGLHVIINSFLIDD